VLEWSLPVCSFLLRTPIHRPQKQAQSDILAAPEFITRRLNRFLAFATDSVQQTGNQLGKLRRARDGLDDDERFVDRPRRLEPQRRDPSVFLEVPNDAERRS